MDHDQGIESVRDGRRVGAELDELEVFGQPLDGGGWSPPRSPITKQAKTVYDADLGLTRPRQAQDHSRQIVFKIVLARGRERADGFDPVDGIGGNYTDVALLSCTAEVETLEVV